MREKSFVDQGKAHEEKHFVENGAHALQLLKGHKRKLGRAKIIGCPETDAAKIEESRPMRKLREAKKCKSVTMGKHIEDTPYLNATTESHEIMPLQHDMQSNERPASCQLLRKKEENIASGSSGGRSRSKSMKERKPVRKSMRLSKAEKAKHNSSEPVAEAGSVEKILSHFGNGSQEWFRIKWEGLSEDHSSIIERSILGNEFVVSRYHNLHRGLAKLLSTRGNEHILSFSGDGTVLCIYDPRALVEKLSLLTEPTLPKTIEDLQIELSFTGFQALSDGKSFRHESFNKVTARQMILILLLLRVGPDTCIP